MKSTFFRTVLILAGVLAVMGCEQHEHEVPSSLGGVWEGTMTVSDNGVTSVKILRITEDSTAEFYDMDYTLNGGYEIKSKEVASIDYHGSGSDTPEHFNIVLNGKTATFTRIGNVLTTPGDDPENPTTYFLTGNSLSYYKAVKLEPSLLPTDAEYTGPRKLSLSLQSTPELTAGIDWMELLVWAGKTAATTAWGKGVGVLLDMLFPASGEDTQLDEILDKVNAISSQLAQMTILYKNTTYEGKLNDRSKWVNELTNFNEEYYIRLSNAKTEEDVSKIILDWASHSVGGNPVYVQGMNYMDFLLTTVIEQRDIFNMYDLYTYNTTAWESQGYAAREGLRASDIAVAAQNLYLTQLYHMFRTDIDDDSRAKILGNNIKKFEEFSEYIKNRPVERHDNRGICQIEGVHFVMDSYPLDYPNYRSPAWSPLPCVWSSHDECDEYFMWGPNRAENFNKALKPEEVKTILNYYAGSGRTLGDIFKNDANIKLGAWIVTSNFNGVVPLQSGYFTPAPTYIGVDCAVFLNSAMTADNMGPVACGQGHIEFDLWTFKSYLYEWYEFYSDYNWVRTNVIERQ
ncbi:MAG: hypothetical protein Q4B16_06565 [Bacteroidia bacterium]|nr:hypothetical protein [Bacteroidia bacterium]